jgi:hypothetical protein
METVREAWTDERLDNLNHRVDEGFKVMREEFRSVRQELRGIQGEIAATNRVMAQLAWSMTGVVLLGFLATIAAILAIV